MTSIPDHPEDKNSIYQWQWCIEKRAEGQEQSHCDRVDPIFKCLESVAVIGIEPLNHD